MPRVFRGNRSQKGFTLAEVMIVIAIIGILAAVAYPALSGHIAKTRRGAATGCLSEFAQFLERNYTLALRYDVDVSNNAVVLPGKQCATDLTGSFTFGLASTATTYTLTATPGSDQSKADSRCGCALTLNQLGTKGVASCSKSVADCW